MTSETPTHLLRLEGVNISAVLYDTNEVSVRRGAGLMLRRAVKDMDKEFGELRSISLGASTGLFETNCADPDKLVDDVSDLLNKKYPHLTFVVDTVPVDNDFPSAWKRVTAANRFRQYRQATLTPPRPVTDADCCPIDRMRPTVPKTDRDNVKKHPASHSVIDRFHYGRKQRQSFYTQELGKRVDDQFTEDLTELSEPAGLKGLGNLQYKMAVIYLDGNRFGKIQRGCATARDLTAFDLDIQDKRRRFLDKLLFRARHDEGFHNGKQLRLETLLWGGDEILLVVPAWRGMQTLHWFFEESHDWHFGQEHLTHAAGIVFCHHKTPLAQAVKTAENLANGVKARNREHNRFDYLVLESIDYPTQPLQEFRDQRYWPCVEDDLLPLAPLVAPSVGTAAPATAPATAAGEPASKSEHPQPEPAEPVPEAATWDTWARHLGSFLDGLPRGAVLDVAQALVAYRTQAVRGSQVQVDQARKRFHDRLERMLAVGARDALNDRRIGGEELRAKLDSMLFKPFGIRDKGDDHAGWLHLVELWDYLAPAVGHQQGGAQ